MIGAALLLAIAVTPYRRSFAGLSAPGNIELQSGCHTTGRLQAIAGSGGLIGLGLVAKRAGLWLPSQRLTNLSLQFMQENLGFIGSIVCWRFLCTLFTRLFNIAGRAPDNLVDFLSGHCGGVAGHKTPINIVAPIQAVPTKGHYVAVH